MEVLRDSVEEEREEQGQEIKDEIDHLVDVIVSGPESGEGNHKHRD